MGKSKYSWTWSCVPANVALLVRGLSHSVDYATSAMCEDVLAWHNNNVKTKIDRKKAERDIESIVRAAEVGADLSTMEPKSKNKNTGEGPSPV